IVYNVMRTADAVTPHGALEVGVTLALFVIVYFVLFGAGIIYILRLMRKGPVPHEGDAPPQGGPGERHTPSRPLSAAPDNDAADTLAQATRG
ncbi:MAG: cytochrome ubiquinol oxidase subunit I, partial [Pollutimonas bauzanensis]